MNTENQLANIPQHSFSELQSIAESVGKSGMFGIQNPAQALTLMLLCQSEGLSPIAALRRYHIIEGKPAMRADAMQGEFQKRGGGILWHLRTDSVVAATFFADAKKMDTKALERSKSRYAAMRVGDNKTVEELAHPGEECIIRTIEDAKEKKTAMSWKDGQWKMKFNWQQSPRQMLTARCVTEGIRLVEPGLIAGILSEDEARDLADTERETFAKEALSYGLETFTDEAIEVGIANAAAKIAKAISKDEPHSEFVAERNKYEDEKNRREEAAEEQRKLNPETKQEAAKPAADTPKESAPKVRKPAAKATPPKQEEKTEAWRATVMPDYCPIAKLRGIKFGDLDPADIKKLKTGWCDAYAEKIALDPVKAALAKIVLEAHRELFPQ